MRLLRLLLLLPLLLPVFPPVRGGEADVAIAITAPGSITVGEKVQFAWDTGRAPYIIRVLVDSSEVKKIKDVKETTFSWVAKGVKAGDKVQIWVHASDEISGKTPQIRVQSAGEGDDAGGGDDEKPTATKSKGDGDGTATRPGSEVMATRSRSKGGDDRASTGKDATAMATEEDHTRAPSSKATSAARSKTSTSSPSTSLRVDSSASNDEGPVTAAEAGPIAGTKPAQTAAPATAPARSSTPSYSESATPRDKTPLFLGVGAIILAILLIGVLIWWWQRNPSSQGARERRANRYRDERSLSKRKAMYRRPRPFVINGRNIDHEMLLSDAGSSSGSSGWNTDTEADWNSKRGVR